MRQSPRGFVDRQKTVSVSVLFMQYVHNLSWGKLYRICAPQSHRRETTQYISGSIRLIFPRFEIAALALGIRTRILGRWA